MSKAKILLVDDEVDLVETVKFRLQINDYDVITAFDGEEGFRKAKSENPDLIILDLRLPKMNGWEICSKLKKDPQYRDIPILLFTASVNEDEEYLKLGADDCLRKPFEPAELLKQLQRLLNKEGKDVKG